MSEQLRRLKMENAQLRHELQQLNKSLDLMSRVSRESLAWVGALKDTLSPEQIKIVQDLYDWKGHPRNA